MMRFYKAIIVQHLWLRCLTWLTWLLSLCYERLSSDSFHFMLTNLHKVPTNTTIFWCLHEGHGKLYCDKYEPSLTVVTNQEPDHLRSDLDPSRWYLGSLPAFIWWSICQNVSEAPRACLELIYLIDTWLNLLIIFIQLISDQ